MILADEQDGTQEPQTQPKEPQDPQPQKPPQEATQEPQGQPAAEPLYPPPDLEDKLRRLIKARADAMTKSVVDDRGRVLREARTPEDAMREAIAYLPTYLRSEQGPEQVRTYMAGGMNEALGSDGQIVKRSMPTGWVPPVGSIKSSETQELEWRAKVGREDNPKWAAVRDYVVDPFGNLGASVLQVPTDLVVGAARHLGIAPPDARIDVLGRTGELLGGSTREELDAIAATSSTGSKIVRGGAGFVGTAAGFSVGLTGKVLGGIGKGVGSFGKSLFGPVGQAIGHGAGVFGAYGGITAEPGKVIEGTAHGAATGAAMGFAQGVVSIALRSLFRAPVASLGPDERGAMDALKKWASENKVFAERGETAAAFEKRIVDTWIGAGLPGAPAMAGRKLVAAAMKGGADAVGFSLLDQQFREDLVDAAWNGDKAKWESVLTKFGGNFLGAAALHMPLSSIVPWQRRQSMTPARPLDYAEFSLRESPPEPKPQARDAEFTVTPKETPLLPAPKEGEMPSLPAPKESRAEKLTREQNEALAEEYAGRWETLMGGGSAEVQSKWEAAIGSSLDNVIALGWRPSERSTREGAEADPGRKVKIELPGSGQSFTIDGENARPSPALREALGSDAEVPTRDLVEMVDKASLVSAMHAKSQLPGEEIMVGVKAVPGRGEEAGTMLRVVMGKVQESPLRSDPQWKDVDVVPARGKDAIEPEQQTVVQELRRIAETRDDIAPPDRSLLNGAIEVLDTVAAGNDQAVAETLAAAPKLVAAVQSGEPGAIKALAESLTTKVPEKAIDDARAAGKKKTRRERPKKPQQSLEDIIRDAEDRSGVDLAAEPREQDQQRLAMESGKLRKMQDRFDAEQMPSEQLRQKIGNQKEKVAEISATVNKAAEDRRASLHDRARKTAEILLREHPELFESRPDFPYVVGNSEYSKRLHAEVAKSKDRSGERGSTINGGPLGWIATAAAEALAAGAKTSLTVVAKAWDAFQQSQIQKVAAIGRDKEAQIGWDATTATKRFQSQMDTAGLMDLRRMSRKQLDSLSEIVRDDIGGGASIYARAMDAGMASHFGRVDLTPEQQAVVDKGRAVTQEAGMIAEEVGIEQTDSKGENARPFKFDSAKQVLVREPTPEMAEARRKGSGPLFEAMLRWLERKYNWTPEEARKQFSTAESLTSLDATEIRRSIPVVPEFLMDVPGMGNVRVYEARPLEHAERLAFRASQILGARSVMPRFAEKPEKGAQSFPTPPGLDPLPPTAQQMVDRVLNESGPDAAQAVADMVRAMHGLPLHRTPSMFAPGEVGYHSAKVVNNLFGLAKAALLTMAAPMNLAEPLQNMAHFGRDAVLQGYRETVRALASGEFAGLHRQGVADGFIADTKLNDPWHGDTTVETVENSLKKAGEILTTPMRMTQDLNELVNYVAARERLAEMRAGHGTKADASSLSLLGFKDAEIEAMLDGRGTWEQYERYQRNIVGELAGGRSQRSAQKSSAGLSGRFNAFVWFTNFFQVRSRMVDRLVRDMLSAPTKAEQFDRAKQIAKALALTGLGGLAGNVVRQFLTGGADGVEDYLREKSSGDAWDVTKNIGGLIASGIVGGVGQPIAEAFGAIGDPENARGRVAEAGIRMLGPLDTVLKIAEGKGLQGMMPAAKAINEGLFGISALAISEKNIKLDNAQDSYYRWLRDNRPGDFSKRGGTEEQKRFRESMRDVVDRIAAGKEWGDQELIEAVVKAESVRMQGAEAAQVRKVEQGASPKPVDVYKQAREAVASSLRARKILPQPGELTTEEAKSLEQHLGEENLQTLRDYDAVLDLMAKNVHNADLRGLVKTN